MKHLLALMALCVAFAAGAQSECPEPLDSNADGLIGVEDLMNVLAHYGDSDLDQDGVFDSVDDCVGEWDECGICNGAGEPCSCGNPVEFYDYQYETVLIGNQCWFAENLKTVLYTNGDSITEAVGGEFGDLGNIHQEGARTLYGGEGAYCSEWDGVIDACDEFIALATYGRLYNYYTVQDSRGVCPVGWHVPSDDDWMALESFMGMSAEELFLFGQNRGNNEGLGTQLKTDLGNWLSDGDGTNDYDFNMLPSSYAHYVVGDFNWAGYQGHFWSSTESEDSDRAIQRYVTFHNPAGIRRDNAYKSYGYSIRCLQD